MSNVALSPWTDVMVDRSREHWLTGMSVTESRDAINAEFGTCFTRNAIIGKRFRLGMTDTALIKKVGVQSPVAKKVIGRSVKRADNKKSGAKAYSPKVMPKRSLTPGASARRLDELIWDRERAARAFYGDGEFIGLMQLTSSTCHWPIDKDGSTLYCGQQSMDAKPYCAKHCAVAYEPRQKKVKAA